MILFVEVKKKKIIIDWDIKVLKQYDKRFPNIAQYYLYEQIWYAYLYTVHLLTSSVCKRYNNIVILTLN